MRAPRRPRTCFGGRPTRCPARSRRPRLPRPPARLLGRRHHREERRAGCVRELDRGSGILERRDHRGPGRERGLEQLEARRGRAGRGGSGGRPSSARKGASTRDDALALAGRRARAARAARSRRSGRRRHARSRHASPRAPRRGVMPLRPSTPSPPARVTSATSSGVFGPPAMPASRIGWRMPRRSLRCPTKSPVCERAVESDNLAVHLSSLDDRHARRCARTLAAQRRHVARHVDLGRRCRDRPVHLLRRAGRAAPLDRSRVRRARA